MMDAASRQKVLNQIADMVIDKADDTISTLTRVCGSPIEVMLGACLIWHSKLWWSGDSLILETQERLTDWSPQVTHFLVPQYSTGGHRFDFLLRDGAFEVFIECDGHAFHEQTKRQAERDRRRLLRFTGSEINRDPMACAESVFIFIDKLYTPIEARG